jgi:hypothetical protein
MPLTPKLQTTEKYYCEECDNYNILSEVIETWRCPRCENLINIKVYVDGIFQSCQRVGPAELKIGDYITLENEQIHEILNILNEDSQFKISLRDHPSLLVNEQDCITKINEAWQDNYGISVHELNNFYSSLTSNEKRYVDLYKSNTNGFAYNINNALRNGSPLENYIEALANLDSAIRKFQNKENIVLHRGTVNSLVLPFINNNIYINPDYLSMSTDLESIGKHFTNPNDPAYVKIICPANMYMAPMESNPQSGGLEHEILLKRNNSFEIIENRITKDYREIQDYLDPFYAEGVDRLHLYTFQSRI